MEAHDEWQVADRPYLSEESMTDLDKNNQHPTGQNQLDTTKVALDTAAPAAAQSNSAVGRGATRELPTPLLGTHSVVELLEEPEGPPQAYDPPTDQWTTVYGAGAGLILYAVVHAHRRVLILRLV